MKKIFFLLLNIVITYIKIKLFEIFKDIFSIICFIFGELYLSSILYYIKKILKNLIKLKLRLIKLS